MLKRLKAACVGLALLLGPGCAGAPPLAEPVTALRAMGQYQLDQLALNATVALMMEVRPLDITCDEDACSIVEGEPEDRTFCSGVRLDDETVLTAAHCVVAADERAGGLFTVQDRDGNSVRGHVERLDTGYDLALLTIDLPGTSLPLGYDPQVGDRVIAAGHPIGLEWSVSHGRVSARRPAGGRYHVPFAWTQVDAPTNGGNSGGPLVDRYGRLIGICSFGFDATEGLSGFVDITEVRAFLAGLPSDPPDDAEHI